MNRMRFTVTVIIQANQSMVGTVETLEDTNSILSLAEGGRRNVTDLKSTLLAAAEVVQVTEISDSLSLEDVPATARGQSADSACCWINPILCNGVRDW